MHKDHNGAEKPLPPGDVTYTKCGSTTRSSRVCGDAGVNQPPHSRWCKRAAHAIVYGTHSPMMITNDSTVLCFLPLRCLLSTYERYRFAGEQDAVFGQQQPDSSCVYGLFGLHLFLKSGFNLWLFFMVTCCTGLQPRSKRLLHTAQVCTQCAL